jgi:hypothetical protein
VGMCSGRCLWTCGARVGKVAPGLVGWVCCVAGSPLGCIALGRCRGLGECSVVDGWVCFRLLVCPCGLAGVEDERLLGAKDGVDLRPAEAADVGAMYRVGTIAWKHWPRLFGRGRPNPHEFGVLLAEDAEQFVVEIDDDVIGVAEIYDHREVSATAWLGIALLPVPDGDALRGRVAVRLADFAFRTMTLRKLYVLEHGFGPPMFADTTAGWVEECCIPEAFLFDGRYWDERVLALSSDAVARTPGGAVGDTA